MSHEAKITAEKFLEKLLNESILTEVELISMLGEARHHLTLPEIEKGLMRESRLSPERIAEFKGEISGYEYLKRIDVGTLTDIDQNVAMELGAVVLDRANPAVAMVEDLPEIMERLEKALGTFDVVICSVSQITDLIKSCYSGSKAEQKERLTDIYNIFDEAIRKKASDIHVSVGLPPIIRVNGRMEELPYQNVDQEWMRSEVARIGGTLRLAKAEKHYDVDMAFPYGSSRFRVNFGADRRGLTMAARKIPTKIPNMEDLGLPRSAQQLCHLDRGLVLVTGPTGSGKSTTLAAMLTNIAMNQSRHIITLEDPIEFHLPNGKSVIHQREMGASFTSFPDGLRQALRQDPDVVLVGEMRDLDTIKTATQAAETGHLVFGTLHTFEASATVTRIVSAFPTDEQDQVRSLLAYILKGIVSQTLLPTASGKGRAAAFEIMISNPAIANNLRKIDGQSTIRQTIEISSKEGMQTMDMALADLVRRRVVTEEAALEKVTDIENFNRRVLGN
jgi:twitching motility protein PilT